MNAQHQPADIVVGLDGSSSARRAFHRAVQEAVWRQANVVAVHVYSMPSQSGLEMLVSDADAYRERAERWIDNELATLTREYEADFPVWVRGIAASGHPGVSLAQAAQGAELLVLGSRGLGGIRGTLSGSVTTYCVHHLPCPLLVVPDAPRPSAKHQLIAESSQSSTAGATS